MINHIEFQISIENQGLVLDSGSILSHVVNTAKIEELEERTAKYQKFTKMLQTKLSAMED